MDAIQAVQALNNHRVHGSQLSVSQKEVKISQTNEQEYDDDDSSIK